MACGVKCCKWVGERGRKSLMFVIAPLFTRFDCRFGIWYEPTK